MNIGAASWQSGLPVKTIRYYEEIGLVRPARSENGYRDFLETDLQRLKFLQRARSLGFSIDKCRELLSLYEDRNRASADVKEITREKIDEIDRKIEELQSLKRVLSDLVRACHGDDRPDCPIIDDLSGAPGAQDSGEAGGDKAEGDKA
ncbi:Cu(I)-responsive transcriptional regulator [Roseibium sp. AS2]|uniref:Cu(I)-responsive transcriptional regulator n=1 Tax=Roseibium sp. AS2 TaxID=3135781 RepID=UPI00317D2917